MMVVKKNLLWYLDAAFHGNSSLRGRERGSSFIGTGVEAILVLVLLVLEVNVHGVVEYKVLAVRDALQTKLMRKAQFAQVHSQFELMVELGRI